MGTWGTAIFSDDFALDIKEEFKTKIGSGKSPTEATNELVSEFRTELSDPDESGIFWLALAAIQWKLGRLQENVKVKAIEIIDQGTDLERWNDPPTSLKKRRLVLDKLKQQLLSEQPIAKKVKLPFICQTKMEKGDLVSYRHSNGKTALFRVMKVIKENCGDCYPEVEFLDFFDDLLPAIDRIETFKRRTLIKSVTPGDDLFIPPVQTFYLAPKGKGDLEPWDKLTLLKRGTEIRSDEVLAPKSLIFWKGLDQFLLKLFSVG